MWIVQVALRRPYTFIVLAILIPLLGAVTLFGMPGRPGMATDIFPEIRIPVISVTFSYGGIAPDEMAGRFTSQFERYLTTIVNDVEHVESQTYPGLNVVKIFFQPGVDINLAMAQVTAFARPSCASCRPAHAAAGHEVQRLDGADHPARVVLDLDERGADLRLRQPVRPRPDRHRRGCGDPLPVRRRDAPGAGGPAAGRPARTGTLRRGREHGARQPEPDPAGRHPEDRRHRVLGEAEFEPPVRRRAERPAHPLEERRGDLHPRRRVRARRPSRRSRTSCASDGKRAVLMSIQKTGSASTIDIVELDQGTATPGARAAARGHVDRSDRRPVGVRQGRGARRRVRGADRRSAHGAHDPAVPRQLAQHADHHDLDPAVDPHLDHPAERARRDHQPDDARRARARGRHPRRRRDRDHREHQPAPRRRPRRGVGDPRGLAPDPGARAGVHARDLHRLRADVPALGRGALPVRADGDGRRFRDADLVRAVADARPDACQVLAAHRRAGTGRSRDPRPLAALPGALRAALQCAAGALPRRARGRPAPPSPGAHRLPGGGGGIAAAGAVPGAELLPGRRLGPDQAAHPRSGRHACRADRRHRRSHRSRAARRDSGARDRQHRRQRRACPSPGST